MIVATTFLTFLWTLIVIFFMVVFFILLFHVIGDLFRRHDASGWKKAAWIVFIVLMPYIGILAYYVTNSAGMATRAERSAQRAEEQYREWATDTSSSPADQIAKAKDLFDAGTITQTEFEQLKAKAVS